MPQARDNLSQNSSARFGVDDDADPGESKESPGIDIDSGLFPFCDVLLRVSGPGPLLSTEGCICEGYDC